MTDRGRAFQILIYAHDCIWHDRRIPLDERTLSCNLLWSLIILTHRTRNTR